MFSDIANVLRIREALWRHRTAGSASVMVGSGFSRNAEPLSSSARPMPTWIQMAQALCEPLYPHDDARRDAALREAAGTSGFLRIAQEYQSAFGTGDLHDRIRALVPDVEYRPGDLHKRLLRLPWADVFTTNWDTLLERGSADVFDRSYDVVRTLADMPSALRPRIVKLHGSFPAHGPFIFTEEDFRTYPTAFAPFVNLVQQAMMETIFCLVGFSGDDPNFLSWSGWVRDNLGPNAPRIYLVGWLELSSHRRRLLEARNVMPVDLSTLPQAADWPEGVRHRHATEWFLAALEVGKPNGVESWPWPTELPTPPTHLVPLPLPTGDAIQHEPHTHETAKVEGRGDVSVILRVWQHNRELYPGWLVAPAPVRQKLWISASEWAWSLTEIERLAPWQRLIALGEFAWRLEQALFPLPSNHEHDAQEALRSIDLSRKTVGGLALPVDAPWADVLLSATFLARAMARNGRHELDTEKFEEALTFLDAASPYIAGGANAAQYERCLWDLAMGRMHALAERLNAWQPAEGDDIWNLRRAGLLAELGDQERARSLLEATLNNVRRNRRRDADDLGALSIESSAIFLGLGFADRRGGQGWRLSEDAPDPFGRGRELRMVDCDVRSEWHSLQQLAEHGEKQRPRVQRRRGFDAGAMHITHRLSDAPSDAMLAAYGLVEMSERTGIPPFARRMSLLNEGLEAAAKVLADGEPALACQFVIRLSAKSETLDEVMSRARVARLPIALVRTLVEVVHGRIAYAWERRALRAAWPDDGQPDLGQAFEVMSRLVVRLPTDDLRSLLEEVLVCYQDAEVRRHAHRYRKELGHLLRRTLEALPHDEVKACLPRLFNMPLASNDGQLGPQGHLDDPVLLLPENSEALAEGQTTEDFWSPIVGTLLVSARAGPQRPAAIHRLFKLHRWDCMSADQTARFAGALWNEGERDAFGLPTRTNLLNWVLLLLPEEQPDQATTALRRFVAERAKDATASTATRVDEVSDVLRAVEREGRDLALSDKDREALRHLVLEWINQPVQEPEDSLLPFGRGEPGEIVTASRLADILHHVTLDVGDLQRLWAKVEVVDSGPDGLAASLYPALSAAFPEREAELVDRLRRALVSDGERVARSATVGCHLWLRAAANTSLLPAPDLEDSLREIGLAIAVRRQSILLAALEFSAWLFREGPQGLRDCIAADCEHGLHALLVEANYERLDPTFDVPEVRAAAVGLAAVMDKVGFGSGAGVQGWLAAAPNDPLPEVRSAVSTN